MRVSAKADYALRAAAELAAASGQPLKRRAIASAQAIPEQFLEQIMLDLKRAGIVTSRRGAEGGYWLSRPAKDVKLADIIRAVEGPLANVQGVRPEAIRYEGSAEALQEVWIAVRASLRSVLETVTLADLARKRLPRRIASLTTDQEAWNPH